MTHYLDNAATTQVEEAVLAVITISFYVIGNAFADAADPKNHVN